MKSRVIFTASDHRYIRLFREMFYPTLRQFGGYEGEVKVVLFGDIDSPTLHALKRLDLAVETGRRRVDPNQIWKFEYAERLQQEYEEVYFYDCDMWFQSDVHPLFELVEPGKLMACEEFTVYKRGHFARNWGFNERNANAVLRGLPVGSRNTVIGWLSGRRVIHGGFFGGADLAPLYRRMQRFAERWPQIGFGFDTTCRNLWGYYFPETIKRVSAKHVFALAHQPREMKTDSRGRLMLGSDLIVAVHVNNVRALRGKIREPHYLRFLAANSAPQLREESEVQSRGERELHGAREHLRSEHGMVAGSLYRP